MYLNPRSRTHHYPDQTYETTRELCAGNHKISDKHEIHIVNEETGLIQIYQPVPRNLTKYGAKEGQQWDDESGDRQEVLSEERPCWGGESL